MGQVHKEFTSIVNKIPFSKADCKKIIYYIAKNIGNQYATYEGTGEYEQYVIFVNGVEKLYSLQVTEYKYDNNFSYEILIKVGTERIDYDHEKFSELLKLF